MMEFNEEASLPGYILHCLHGIRSKHAFYTGLPFISPAINQTLLFFCMNITCGYNLFAFHSKFRTLAIIHHSKCSFTQ